MKPPLKGAGKGLLGINNHLMSPSSQVIFATALLFHWATEQQARARPLLSQGISAGGGVTFFVGEGGGAAERAAVRTREPWSWEVLLALPHCR